MRVISLGALAVLTAAACTDTVGGLQPVGGDEPSVAELSRFARRLHLDLTGRVPDDAALAAAVERLQTDGNTADTRRALAAELLAGAAFAETFVAELENRALGGATLIDQYNFYCSVIRDSTAYPDCLACGAPTEPQNACSGCGCYLIADLDAERTALLAAADDLAGGDATTGDVERAYGGAMIFRFTFGDPAGVAGALFEIFLGRAPEADELFNAANMVNGSVLGPEFPAGLLFHRHGATVDDLVDIVFDSEAFREAHVDAAFRRYLGRPASAAELRFFVAGMDAGAPDARDVIEAITSSREYFEQ